MPPDPAVRLATSASSVDSCSSGYTFSEGVEQGLSGSIARESGVDMARAEAGARAGAGTGAETGTGTGAGNDTGTGPRARTGTGTRTEAVGMGAKVELHFGAEVHGGEQMPALAPSLSGSSAQRMYKFGLDV